MTPPDSTLTVTEAIIWITFVIRDFAAIWAVAMAGIALLVMLIKLLVRSRARLGNNIITSGMLAWVFTAVGCFAPLNKGLIFGRDIAVLALIVSGALWVLVIIINRLTKSRDE
jgi:hypothetical protein